MAAVPQYFTDLELLFALKPGRASLSIIFSVSSLEKKVYLIITLLLTYSLYLTIYYLFTVFLFYFK